MSENATLLDSTAKEALRKMVRGLRIKLVDEISDAAEGEYQLAVDHTKAKLGEAQRCRRDRLEAWIEEQLRASAGAAEKKTKPKADKDTRIRYLRQAVQEAAHTLLHRLVLLRILEHHRLLSPPVITGGLKSAAYEAEFAHYAGPLKTDPTLGYKPLLDTVFGELSLELPGLFGTVGLTDLFPIPAATLRDLVSALNDPALDCAWGDDTTLGWVYQYWNDPDREALDKKIADGGKIEPHEIAQKTQMFTERYMVEWLLDNSLGLTWLCTCKKNGWKAEAEDVLPVLDARRAEWRKRREAGEVELDALMPIEPGLENAWKYYVPQPIPPDAIDSAPASVRDLKLLDPACGSGHFLVIAFDRLTRMYEEEARHRNVQWSNEEIAESILANNLHGIDIDPRAIQIAAAALWLKAKLYAPNGRLDRLNLVAPVLRLARLTESDPALVRLRDDLEREVGLPKPLTTKLVQSLAGVDYLGSLLKVDKAAEDALKAYEEHLAKNAQTKLFEPNDPAPIKRELLTGDAKATVLAKLEAFLGHHSASEDLGVRLDGEQLAAGVRFVRIAREGAYDVVVGNPPYQGLSKTERFEYVVKNYPRGKADLFAAFLERGLELVREGGVSAQVTMRGWMFLGQYRALREYLLSERDLHAIADLDSGAFEEVSAAQVVLSVACSVFVRRAPDIAAVALRPTPTEDRASAGMTDRKRAGLLAQVGRYEFDPKGFAVIEGEPIVYWWTKEFLRRYGAAQKLGTIAPVRQGLATANNARFLRVPWEIESRPSLVSSGRDTTARAATRFVPYIKGASGQQWIEPLQDVVNWCYNGLEVRTYELAGRIASRPQNQAFYFRRGIAFTTIGASFCARLHLYPSIFGDMGQSVFPEELSSVLCAMNAKESRFVLESLNPTIHFLVGDVARLPLFPVDGSDLIVSALRAAFEQHEAGRESAVEFTAPGPSAWRYAQDWAQRAVDRAGDVPLPSYEPEHDPPAAEAHLSFAIGVAFGRFGANGEGVLDDPSRDTLPAGIFFVGPGVELSDSLDTDPGSVILSAWAQHQAAITEGRAIPLRDWLRKDFFAYHKALYENRPIYFPLSSEKKTFVAWVSIHRWTDRTLQTLLAEHVQPILRKLDGEIADLAVARASSDKKTSRAADQRFVTAMRLRDELGAFAELISACAERGAPPTDAQCPPRAADAPYVMDLDDGVMINSAALWPLLAPQWSDPKKWWKQLCLAEGKKDYDWSHLARRYFPGRVEEKCKKDPSLAVAHGCFWKYHPAKAYAWELRLQDEIREGFTIDEDGSDAARARFVTDHPAEAEEIRAKEVARRERRRRAEASAEPASDEEVDADDD